MPNSYFHSTLPFLPCLYSLPQRDERFLDSQTMARFLPLLSTQECLRPVSDSCWLLILPCCFSLYQRYKISCFFVLYFVAVYCDATDLKLSANTKSSDCLLKRQSACMKTCRLLCLFTSGWTSATITSGKTSGCKHRKDIPDFPWEKAKLRLNDGAKYTPMII